MYEAERDTHYTQDFLDITHQDKQKKKKKFLINIPIKRNDISCKTIVTLLSRLSFLQAGEKM